jgi:lactoylglutathione lyase
MADHIHGSYTILFVRDQQKSRLFYENILRQKPVLDVPGMTAFELSPGHRLGLMPATDIRQILDNKIPDPADAGMIPRCEIYLLVEDVGKEFENAMTCGASLISKAKVRSWGDIACYFADPDGHLIAFAQPDYAK